MNYFNSHKVRVFLQWLVLALLVAVVAITLYQTVNNFETLRLRGNIQPRRRHNQARLAANPDQIQGWMTFRYINLVFRLPPDYLKTQLIISDTRYPNLLLGSAAKEQKISSAQIIAKTIAAVKNYLSAPPKPPA